MNKRKLLAKTRNNPRDVRFSDLILLAEAHGFRLHRVRGSHRIFVHDQLPDQLNLQPDQVGKAKQYQVNAFLRLVDEYALRLEDDDDA